MATLLYCWRCRTDVPMLTDNEWSVVAQFLPLYKAEVQEKFEAGNDWKNNTDGTGWLPGVLAAYEKFTGVHETNVNVIFHHQISMYGPPCQNCGKPLRTPAASYCPMCGAERHDAASR
jgi:hypothetical protein